MPLIPSTDACYRHTNLLVPLRMSISFDNPTKPFSYHRCWLRSAVSLLLRGEMPTEMFLHFFKSLSDASKMNLNIKAEGQNEHHKIEGIFKALARALKMAVRRDIYHYELPSTKGML